MIFVCRRFARNKRPEPREVKCRGHLLSLGVARMTPNAKVVKSPAECLYCRESWQGENRFVSDNGLSMLDLNFEAIFDYYLPITEPCKAGNEDIAAANTKELVQVG